MKTVAKTVMCCAILAAASLQPAFAYLGPGGVISGLGALLALVAAVLVAILGFLWFPIKRLMSKRRKSSTADSGGDDAG